jgi:hypothetical protein
MTFDALKFGNRTFAAVTEALGDHRISPNAIMLWIGPQAWTFLATLDNLKESKGQIKYDAAKDELQIAGVACRKDTGGLFANPDEIVMVAKLKRASLLS